MSKFHIERQYERGGGVWVTTCPKQGRIDHWGTRALPEGPGSIGGPMRCPWYLS
ncbi:unnamed protein product [Staurois parvus]|uniref:Uncharacterized protein n=1 Tax=Staurois parvus TaxID=386267 RepID=A0ABN9CHV0_9NEOB|nr:unnamed protein product [Staurois parvus]